MPKVTIITICYNVVNDIEKTIKSVVNQTYPNIEYIIIDGGSSDGTINIIKKYTKKIALWISEPDDGIYDAMNKGIMKSTGDWLNFMNAGDSFAKTNVIEEMSNSFSSENKIIYGNYIACYKNIKVRHKGLDKQLDAIDFIFNGIHHQASFFQRSLFDKYGLYDTKYHLASDWKFYMDSIGFGKEKTRYVNIDVNFFEMGGASTNNSNLYSVEHDLMLKEYFGDYYFYMKELAEYRQSKVISFLLSVRLFIKRIGLGRIVREFKDTLMGTVQFWWRKMLKK